MIKKVGGALLVAAVAALALAQSWQRWLDPIIDTGRDLYIPEQLLHGARLYRDIRYQYPPLAPYLLTLIGRSLAGYTAFGIAQSIVIAGALWIALTRNTIGATVATLFFVALSLCGASTWGANCIFPYSYAATIGMALLMIALAALVHERVPYAFAALLLASWCKVEYAIAVAIVMIVVIVTKRATWKQIAIFVTAWLASAIAIATYFGRALTDNVFAASLTHGARAKRFFSVIAGTADLQGHAIEIAIALAGTIAIVVLLNRRRPLFTVGAVAIALLIADHSFFRVWVVVELAALAWALARDRRSPLALFAAFAIGTTLRIPANVSPFWYGFVLIIPVYALIAYVLFDYLPERGVYSDRASLAWLPLVALICARDLMQQHDRWSVKVFPIVTARGMFYDANPTRAAEIDRFLDSHPRGTLAVMPEGLTINYLAMCRTPLSFHTFTPVETADTQIEDEILAECNAHPPDRIAIVARDVSEYGSRGFGIDYDLRLAAWIRAHYRVEHASPQLTTLTRR